MSNLAIDLYWQRGDSALLLGQYSAAHQCSFRPRLELDLDAGPDWGGDPDCANPEQALAAALSSCHEIPILALAAYAGCPVASFSVSEAELTQMQGRAHQYCFVANALDDTLPINIH